MIYNTNYGIAAGLINCWIIGVNNMEFLTQENIHSMSIRSSWELKHIVNTLGLVSTLNTKEENKRLSEAKAELKKRSK